MGFGTALGAAVTSWEKAEAERLKEEEERVLSDDSTNPYSDIREKAQLAAEGFEKKEIVEPPISLVGQEYSMADNGAHTFLKSKEGVNNTATTKNMAGSSAYGEFQFMPSTAMMYAEKIGMDPNTWTEPNNQKAIMAYAKNDYIGKLNSWGLDNGESNQYVIHQLGPSRARRYFTNKLTDNDVRVMNDNLPSDKKGTSRDQIINNWKMTYND